MRWSFAVLVMIFPLLGCGGPESPAGSDCSLAVHRDATTYIEAGFTEHAASKVGKADGADCDDMGADARGAYFAENPHQVDVWSFDGLDSSKVIGVRESNGIFRVFIAEAVSKAEAKELSRVLPRASTNDPQGVTVTAAREVLVSTTPLGDAGVASLVEGDSVTASCFVARAQTNIGARGSAVRVEAGDETGYAAVAIRDVETDERITFLEQSEHWLRSHLPEC